MVYSMPLTGDKHVLQRRLLLKDLDLGSLMSAYATVLGSAFASAFFAFDGIGSTASERFLDIASWA